MHIKRSVPQCILAVLLSVFMVLALLPAPAAAGDTTSQIGFTSDVHGRVDNLETWLDKLDDTTPSLNHFIFGGDFDYNESNCNVTAANSVAAVRAAFPGTPVYTARGNHDRSDAADFGNKGVAPITEENIGYNTGLIYDGPDYAVYILDSSSQSFVNSDVDALSAALDTIEASDPSKPVLVVSHIPIHYLSDFRNSGNTAYLLDALNPHPNVIFLWGHNHSQNDPDYGIVRKAGYNMKHTSSDSTPINFTYSSIGAMYNNVNGAYGLLLTVTKGTNTATVTFDYRNLGGETVAGDFVLISNEIDSVALTGLAAPVGGAAPDTDAVASGGAISPVTVCWTEESAHFTGAFTAGNTYAASMTLTPVSGRAFTAATTVTVNGAAASAVLNGDGTLTVTYAFTAGEPVEVYTKSAAPKDGHEYVIVMSGKAMNSVGKTGTYNSNTYTGLGYTTPVISSDKSTLTFDSPADAAASTWLFKSAGTAGQWYISNQGSNVYTAASRALGLDGTNKTAWTYGTLNEKMQLHADLDDSGTAKQCKIYYGHAGSTKTVDFFYPTVNNDGDLTLYEKNGTIVDPEPESTVYKEVSALKAGGSYIIVANDGTADYAVKFQTVEGENYNVGAAAVTITDGAGYFDGGISLAGTDVIVTDNDSLMWIYDGNNEFLSTANSAYHLYGGKIDTKTGKSGDYTPGLYSVKLDRDCIYTAGHKMYSDGSSNYYHVLSGGKFDVTTAAENGSVIRLFREVDGSHGEPPADPGYPLATSIESGSTYVIVAKKDGNAYALTTGTGSEENTLSGAPVTVSDNKVSAAGVTDAMKWLFTADGNGYDVTNGSCYLNRKSGGGLLVKAEEDAAGYSDWIYDDDNRLYTYNHSTENYLYLSDGNPGCFSTDTSTDENITIYLYKVTGTPVDRVAVTDIAPPAAGAAPDTSAGTDIGTVRSVSWQPAVHGTFAGNTAYTVSVTLSVPEGYFFTSDTAAALNGQKAAPVLNADGTLTVSYRFPKTGAVHVIDYEPITPKKFFTDVKAGEWYYDAVKFVVNNGLFSGTSDMTFEPQTPMTRAMLMTVLYRREGSPAVSASNPFPDVPAGEWFTDAVLWARRNSVAAGYPDGTFRPDTNLTREQLAVFLCNYARYKGYDMARKDSFNLRIFGDAAEIPDYAGEAMKWACGVGLMRGKPGSLLAPKDNASRAEVAAILKRFVEGIED